MERMVLWTWRGGVGGENDSEAMLWREGMEGILWTELC